MTEKREVRIRLNRIGKIAVFIGLILLICAVVPASPPGLEVHFLDVGQGDCAVVLCGGEAMIIDGGPPGASSKVYAYIHDTLKLRTIRIMAATHPHDDHVGGLSGALNAAPVELLLTPVTEWDSSPFRSMMEIAGRQGTAVTVPYDGDVYTLGEATVTVLMCWPEAWTVNDSSIVLRVDYGGTSFLFTGDAEEMLEYMLVDSGCNLHADVLKVAHHGSNSSSTGEFINAVSPSYAVISCGRDNDYRHPRQEILDRLRDAGADVLRTDLQGTIVFTSNGDSIGWTAQKRTSPEALLQAPQEPAAERMAIPDETGYIGNANRHIFHHPDCSSVTKMKEKNKVYFATREEAVEAGYTPCGQCKP